MNNLTSKFFILEDDNYKNEIIKLNNGIYYRYIFGTNEWYKTHLLDKYMDEKSSYYNLYRQVSNAEIMPFIVKQLEFYSRMWNLAYNLAIEKHSGMLDKTGNDYTLHVIDIANKFEEYDLKIIAIMHDLIKTTDVSLNYLEEKGFPKKIIVAMNAITRLKNEEYFEYINRLKKNNIARKVKIEDLIYNINLYEKKPKTTENLNTLSRYKKALEILKEI